MQTKAPIRILLCEDDPNLGRLLSDYLTAKGYETTWAKDGVEGLKEFHRQSFDFALLDVMMPRKDGLEVAEEIRLSAISKCIDEIVSQNHTSFYLEILAKPGFKNTDFGDDE